MPRTKGDCKRQEKPINQGNTANTRSFKDMIKILFVCHGRKGEIGGKVWKMGIN